jgi:hypothetical protein
MRLSALLLATSALAAPLLVSQAAHAGVVDSCGSLDFSGMASCSVEVKGGCTAKCEPIAFTAQCAVDLQVSCDGECQATLPSCNLDCQGGCVADCEANAEWDCEASCSADCDGNCSAACAEEADKTKCEASCQATCSAECSGSCNGATGNANCEASCNGCCTGSCNGEARLACQIDCQASGYASCETKLQGGCEAKCEEPEGALFCDGQFVDVSNLDQCVADLAALFNIEVTGYAKADCEGNECKAEAGGSIGCSTSSFPGSSEGALSLLGLAGIVALMRKKRG